MKILKVVNLNSLTDFTKKADSYLCYWLVANYPRSVHIFFVYTAERSYFWFPFLFSLVFVYLQVTCDHLTKSQPMKHSKPLHIEVCTGLSPVISDRSPDIEIYYTFNQPCLHCLCVKTAVSYGRHMSVLWQK